jgi:putative ABC transport system permease protein
MSSNIRPLLSALRRNPTGALLVAVQVAITLAVLVNAAWIVTQRIEKIDRPTGIDTRDTFVIDILGLSKRFKIAQAESEDLAYLRGLPGVVAATATAGTPLTLNGGDTDLARSPRANAPSLPANFLAVGEQGLKALDIPLVAGRNFTSDEIRPAGEHSPISEVIITRSLARALFPHGNALGQAIYEGNGNPLTVIGVTRDFMGPQIGAPVYNTMLVPEMPGEGGFYGLLVRTRPGMRTTVLREAKEHIGASHRHAVIAETQTLSAAKREFEANNRNMAIFLTSVTTLMLAVCCLGIFGLTTFNVSSRTRQIGTRRALGARKRDVVTHFIVENSLILAAGALPGAVLALAVGNWLTAHYSLPRLDLAYLAGGILVLWGTGLLAAWQPARRAASIPPSVATRTI